MLRLVIPTEFTIESKEEIKLSDNFSNELPDCYQINYVDTQHDKLFYVTLEIYDPALAIELIAPFCSCYVIVNDKHGKRITSQIIYNDNYDINGVNTIEFTKMSNDLTDEDFKNVKCYKQPAGWK